MTPAEMLQEIAGNGERGERIKGVIERVARRCGLTYWRTFDIWYGKARRIEEAERACIAEALAKKRREETRNELHELRTRLLKLEARLAQEDPDFHRATAHPHGALLRRSG